MLLLDNYGPVTKIKDKRVAYLQYVFNAVYDNRILLDYPDIFKRIKRSCRYKRSIDKLLAYKMPDERVIFNIVFKKDNSYVLTEFTITQYLKRIKNICIKNNIKYLAMKRPNFWFPYEVGCLAKVKNILSKIFKDTNITIYMCYGEEQ